MKNYKDIKINNLPDRELEIIGSIPAEKMTELREKALKKFAQDVELQGFRKGNAPLDLVAQKVGEMRIMEEAAEIALTEEYPKIIDEHKIDPIGRPEIQITKMAPGNDLEFKIKTALYPEVKLSDYKKLAKKQNSESQDKEVEATPKEVEDVILNIRKNVAHEKLHAEHGPEHKHEEIKDEDLPALDDDFAKSLGEFKDVEDLKLKIRENITTEKKLKEKDKNRTEILEKIMQDSKIELPKIIVDGELEKMLAQFKDDIAKNGISYEEYLKHIKKTEDEIKEDWKDTAIKRAKSQIILNTIAKDEGITPKEEEVKKEMDNILTHYKDADRFRVRMYVETFITNELVFQFLENQK